MSKELMEVLKKADDLSNAAGRVINHTGLADLQNAISKLNLELVQYDKAVDKMKKATCNFCAVPCGTSWCSTKGGNNGETD